MKDNKDNIKKSYKKAVKNIDTTSKELDVNFVDSLDKIISASDSVNVHSRLVEVNDHLAVLMTINNQHHIRIGRDNHPISPNIENKEDFTIEYDPNDKEYFIIRTKLNSFENVVEYTTRRYNYSIMLSSNGVKNPENYTHVGYEANSFYSVGKINDNRSKTWGDVNNFKNLSEGMFYNPHFYSHPAIGEIHHNKELKGVSLSVLPGLNRLLLVDVYNSTRVIKEIGDEFIKRPDNVQFCTYQDLDQQNQAICLIDSQIQVIDTYNGDVIYYNHSDFVDQKGMTIRDYHKISDTEFLLMIFINFKENIYRLNIDNRTIIRLNEANSTDPPNKNDTIFDSLDRFWAFNDKLYVLPDRYNQFIYVNTADNTLEKIGPDLGYGRDKIKAQLDAAVDSAVTTPVKSASKKYFIIEYQYDSETYYSALHFDSSDNTFYEINRSDATATLTSSSLLRKEFNFTTVKENEWSDSRNRYLDALVLIPHSSSKYRVYNKTKYAFEELTNTSLWTESGLPDSSAISDKFIDVVISGEYQNKDVFCIPKNAHILHHIKIRTGSKTIKTYDIDSSSPQKSGDNKFSHVFMNNNLIYCIPNRFESVFAIDTNNKDILKFRSLKIPTDKIGNYDSENKQRFYHAFQNRNSIVCFSHQPNKKIFTLFHKANNLSNIVIGLYTVGTDYNIKSIISSFDAKVERSRSLALIDDQSDSTYLQNINDLGFYRYSGFDTDGAVPNRDAVSPLDTTTTNKFSDSVVVGDIIYSIPGNSDRIMKFNTKTKQFITEPIPQRGETAETQKPGLVLPANSDVDGISIGGNDKFSSAVLVDENSTNPKIYLIPSAGSNRVVKVLVSSDDQQNDGVSVIGSNPIPTPNAGDNKRYSGAIKVRNKIYCIPYDSNHILIINTETDEMTTVTSRNNLLRDTIYNNSRFKSAQLIGTIIYFIPYNSPWPAAINTSNDTLVGVVSSSIFNSDTGKRFITSIMAGGVIYNIPYDYEGILKWDPTNSDFDKMLNQLRFNQTDVNLKKRDSQKQKFSDAVLVKNRYIYCIPYDFDYVVKFDITTNSFTTLDLPSTFTSRSDNSAKFSSAILDEYGFIYCVPFKARSGGLKIDTNYNDQMISINRYHPNSDERYSHAVKVNSIVYFVPYKSDRYYYVRPFAEKNQFSTFSINEKLAVNTNIQCHIKHLYRNSQDQRFVTMITNSFIIKDLGMGKPKELVIFDSPPFSFKDNIGGRNRLIIIGRKYPTSNNGKFVIAVWDYNKQDLIIKDDQDILSSIQTIDDITPNSIFYANSILYLTTKTHNKFIKIHLNNEITFSEMGVYSTPSGTNSPFCKINSVDGKIAYAIPNNHNKIAKLNLESDQVEDIGSAISVTNGDRFSDLVEMNDRLYGIPKEYTKIVEIDPLNATTPIREISFPTQIQPGNQLKAVSNYNKSAIYLFHSANHKVIKLVRNTANNAIVISEIGPIIQTRDPSTEAGSTATYTNRSIDYIVSQKSGDWEYIFGVGNGIFLTIKTSDDTINTVGTGISDSYKVKHHFYDKDNERFHIIYQNNKIVKTVIIDLDHAGHAKSETYSQILPSEFDLQPSNYLHNDRYYGLLKDQNISNIEFFDNSSDKTIGPDLIYNDEKFKVDYYSTISHEYRSEDQSFSPIERLDADGLAVIQDYKSDFHSYHKWLMTESEQRINSRLALVPKLKELTSFYHNNERVIAFKNWSKLFKIKKDTLKTYSFNNLNSKKIEFNNHIDENNAFFILRSDRTFIYLNRDSSFIPQLRHLEHNIFNEFGPSDYDLTQSDYLIKCSVSKEKITIICHKRIPSKICILNWETQSFHTIDIDHSDDHTDIYYFEKKIYLVNINTDYKITNNRFANMYTAKVVDLNKNLIEVKNVKCANYGSRNDISIIDTTDQKTLILYGKRHVCLLSKIYEHSDPEAFNGVSFLRSDDKIHGKTIDKEFRRSIIAFPRKHNKLILIHPDGTSKDLKTFSGSDILFSSFIKQYEHDKFYLIPKSYGKIAYIDQLATDNSPNDYRIYDINFTGLTAQKKRDATSFTDSIIHSNKMILFPNKSGVGAIEIRHQLNSYMSISQAATSIDVAASLFESTDELSRIGSVHKIILSHYYDRNTTAVARRCYILESNNKKGLLEISFPNAQTKEFRYHNASDTEDLFTDMDNFEQINLNSKHAEEHPVYAIRNVDKSFDATTAVFLPEKNSNVIGFLNKHLDNNDYTAQKKRPFKSVRFIFNSKDQIALIISLTDKKKCAIWSYNVSTTNLHEFIEIDLQTDFEIREDTSRYSIILSDSTESAQGKQYLVYDKLYKCIILTYDSQHKFALTFDKDEYPYDESPQIITQVGTTFAYSHFCWYNINRHKAYVYFRGTIKSIDIDKKAQSIDFIDHFFITNTGYVYRLKKDIKLESYSDEKKHRIESDRLIVRKAKLNTSRSYRPDTIVDILTEKTTYDNLSKMYAIDNFGNEITVKENDKAQYNLYLNNVVFHPEIFNADNLRIVHTEDKVYVLNYSTVYEIDTTDKTYSIAFADGKTAEGNIIIDREYETYPESENFRFPGVVIRRSGSVTNQLNDRLGVVDNWNDDDKAILHKETGGKKNSIRSKMSVNIVDLTLMSDED